MNFQQKLSELSQDSSWRPDNGLASGNGVGYWFVNDKCDEAYVNDDQGYITIFINGKPVWNNENECMERECLK